MSYVNYTSYLLRKLSKKNILLLNFVFLEFNKDEIEIKDSKGGNFRVIPLTKDTLEKIDRLYNFLKNSAGKIFQKENGNYITIKTFQSWMAGISKAIGIPKNLSHTHSLRH